MMISVFTAIVSSLTLFNFGSPAVQTFDGPTANYTCQTATWDAPPGTGFDHAVDSSLFGGTIGADCEFDAISDGGIPELNSYLLDYAVHGPEIQQVFSGPTPETYDSLPSNYFDESVAEKDSDGNVEATVREDSHIATDGSTVLEFAEISKDIQGTGTAAMLKQLDVLAIVKPTATPNHYAFRLQATIGINKPWYAPAGTVQSEIEKQVTKIESQVITQMAQHI